MSRNPSNEATSRKLAEASYEKEKKRTITRRKLLKNDVSGLPALIKFMKQNSS
jgi:hypothetical protein